MFIFGLILGIILGAVGYYFIDVNIRYTREMKEAQAKFGDKLRQISIDFDKMAQEISAEKAAKAALGGEKQ